MSEEQKNSKMPKLPKFKFNLYWVYALIGIFLIVINILNTNPSSKEIP